MFCGGGFELSLVFRACFVGALLDRGLGPLGLVCLVACFVRVLQVFRGCLINQLVNQLVDQLVNRIVNQLVNQLNNSLTK